MLKAARLFVNMLLLLLGTQARADETGAEILSKADSAAMFAMSKADWNTNVRGAAAQGMVRAVPGPNDTLKMGMQMPLSMLMVAPSYDAGPRAPSFLQVMVVYPPATGKMIDEAAAEAVKQKAVQDLRPDYDVIALHERTPEGLMFSFIIRPSP